MEINSKICMGCKIDRPFSEYTKAKLGKYGLRSKCKACRADEAAVYHIVNKELVSARGKRYREKNAEEISVRRAVRTLKTKGMFTEYRKQWAKDNPGKVNAKTARRRATKLKATPKWLTKEQFKEIELFYVEAARLTRELGTPYEVDHIIPLQGKTVTGLHVPWNLRVVPRTVNRHKSRKVIP